MIEKQVTVSNATGLHMRPGKLFSEEAKKYECEVEVVKGDKVGNAKSLIKLLTVGISQGDTITIRTNGADEEKASEELVTFIENLDD